MTLARTQQHLAFAVLLTVAGCGTSSDGNDGGNCANNPVGCICITDANCGAPNPVCNNSNGQCVKCLPSNDVCPQGQHCINDGGNYTCVETSKCVTSADCPKKKVGAVPACCAGTCVDDVSADKDNCGGCNVKCGPYANAAAACLGGSCLIGTCENGFANCDGSDKNGCEANLQTDTKHCGSCPTSCSAGGNATATCAAGKCGVTCVQGFSDCNGRTEDGCETATAIDARNCGSCGKACGPLNNAATVVCVNGACTAGACAGWFGDCNGKTDDGCESDTQADAANCGGCGKACPAVANGKAGCGNGTCTVASCSAGFGDCDGDAKNGCEARTSSDARNCGACGVVCAGPNGQQSCSGGACVVSACNQGFADCDMKAANGCEINILSDINHCNGCGMACPAAPNTLPSCRLGVCSPGPCKPGFADCNADPSDGCEVDITTTSNCGACGVVCAVPANATSACRNGQCQIGMCNQGFSDCNLQLGDGCERNVNTDNNNCGICGLVCVPPMGGNIGNQCTQGKCVVGGCVPGYDDCNKNINDGCEVSLNGDANNCGACGNVCPMNTPFCGGGQCTNSVHNTVAWPAGPYAYRGNSCNLVANGVQIGNFEAINLGKLTWKNCMIEASKRSAIVTSPTYGSWPLPGWWATRAPNSNLAMTGQWANYISADINTQQNCNVMREPQSVALKQWNTKGNLANNVTYDGNNWSYQDFGVMYIDQCMLLAGQYGASVITPWTIGLPNGDNYWQGILHTCSVYSWSSGNGTNFAYDNSINRISQKGCMLGWING